MAGPFLVIPPTLRRLLIAKSLLEETMVLLAGPGEAGLEAVVLWLGSVVSPFDARVGETYFPRQIGYSTALGLAVEISVEEWTDLALRLTPGHFVLAKVHSHAGMAYHSDVDAANPYLCHEGAIAITVPYFASSPIGSLDGWSVNVLRNQRWIELRLCDINRTIIVEEESA